MILIMCLLSSVNYSQQPETVLSIAKVAKPHEWYLKQAELWWKEVEKDKKNENAWYNYFKANRYACMTYNNINAFDGKKNDGWIKESSYLMEAEEIIKKADQYIPDTYTSNCLRVYGYSNEDESFKYLQRAYEIDPNRPEALDGLVTYYETHGNLEKRKEFNLKWYKTNDLSSGFLAYNYNVLMTIKPNGVILTFGDNDTYSSWFLQDVFGIRKDVTVLNVPLLSDKNYRDSMFKKLNIPEFKEYTDDSSESEKEILAHILKNRPQTLSIYVGLPAWKQLKEYENNLYLVGLALEYSSENIDNIALLKNNFENLYVLDYVKQRFEYDICDEQVNRMNINYLPGIFKLYKHYTLSGDEMHAKKIKELGLGIAQKGGQEWMDKATKEFK